MNQKYVRKYLTNIWKLYSCWNLFQLIASYEIFCVVTTKLWVEVFSTSISKETCLSYLWLCCVVPFFVSCSTSWALVHRKYLSIPREKESRRPKVPKTLGLKYYFQTCWLCFKSCLKLVWWSLKGLSPRTAPEVDPDYVPGELLWTPGIKSKTKSLGFSTAVSFVWMVHVTCISCLQRMYMQGRPKMSKSRLLAASCAAFGLGNLWS